MDYPEWLKKYKTKGVYARKTRDGYALYKGHSERVQGRAYPRFVCDEYLGIATEAGGLRPSSPPVKKTIRVKRFGLWAVADSLCGWLRELPEFSRQDASALFIRAFLTCFGIAEEDYGQQWISLEYPPERVFRELSRDEGATVNRLSGQIGARLKEVLGDDWDLVTGKADEIYAVFVNEGWHVSECPQELEEKAVKYNIRFLLSEGDGK